jgi:hypothetical protein
MRGHIQDVLRLWISLGVRVLGAGLEWTHRLRVMRSLRTQRRLRARYRITDTTPIVRHGAALSARLETVAGDTATFAATSGSSGTPKRIPYTPARVRQVKGLYMDAFSRAFSAKRVRRTSLYVFSTTASDDSLTSLMMAEPGALPPYFSTLQAPYRVHSHPDMVALESRYGRPAVRLWVLVLSNPGALYATNPSTVALFLEQLAHDWAGTTRMVQDWSQTPEVFSTTIHRIAARLDSAGSSGRLQRIADSTEPLAFLSCVPAVSFLCCWDGGYVRSYLDRVWALMSPERVRHVPMYSMSTETVETLPDFRNEDVAFLPVAPGVLYEFLPLGVAAEPGHLLSLEALSVGERYVMVVSDQWGLVRYHTEDVFLVRAHVAGLPDLRFERREGLSFSFTGEKLTGDHARLALDHVRQARPDVEAVPWMVVVPSADPEPHYKLVLASDTPILSHDELADLLDEGLSQVNQEYADKRKSGRLGMPKTVCVRFEHALRTIGGQTGERSWETQFKFLPMVTRTWESVGTAREE